MENHEKYFKYITILVFSLSLSFNTKAQNEAYPKQKVYIHFDKDFYVLGETMWFKAYIMNIEPIPDSLNQVLYLDIVNEEGKVKTHLKLKTSKNSSSSSFSLPTDWNEGVYHIRAYTPYLFTFDETAFFSKTIPVYNADAESVILLQTEKNTTKHEKTEVSFFPEGGLILAGFENRIAFLAQNENGEGKCIKGLVKDDRDSIITRFESLNYHLKDKPQGLGIFTIKAQKYTLYKVEIELETGETKIYDLPKVSEKGSIVSINTNKDDEFLIQVSGNENHNLKLKIVNSGRTHFESSFSISEETPLISKVINKYQLPEGLLLCQLYNSTDLLISERLFFNQKKSLNTIQISNSQTNFHQRQNTKINLEAQNTSHAGFSLVARKKTPFDQHENINSYYWLSSELANPIENAAFYLDNYPSSKEALDIMLITQKIKSPFSQTKHLKNVNNIYILEGIARDSLTQKPLILKPLAVFSMQRQTAYTTHTDTQGHFKITLNDKYDYQTFFFFCLENIKEVNPPVSIEIIDHFPKTYQVLKKQLAFSPEIQRYLLDYNKRKLIESNFNNKTFNQSETEENPFKDPFPIDATQSMILSEYVEFFEIKEIFREVFYFVTAREKKGNTKIRIIADQKQAYFLKSPPLYIIDGQPTFDQEMILGLSPAILERIDVYSKYLDVIDKYGILGAGGVVSFITKKKLVDLKNNSNVIQTQLYHPEFEYKDKNFAENQMTIPFFSPLLTWKPNLILNMNQSNQISFYNGDDIGDFEIIIEGVNSDNKPIYGYFPYKISFDK